VVSQPPDRFPTGWYAWDEELSRVVRTPDPYRRARQFIAAAGLGASLNAIILAAVHFVTDGAAPGAWLLVGAAIGATWAIGLLDILARYHIADRIGWLAIGAILYLAVLAFGWWQVATGLPVTGWRIAAGVAQLTVVIAAGSVYLWARRQP
jgi:hypothetical protein